MSAVEDELDRLGEALPLVDLEAERAAALPGDGVVASAAVVLGGLPVALDVAFVLEALEGGVEGALVDVEASFGKLLDAFAESPAVHGLEGEGLEDQEVDGAAEGIGLGGVAGRHGRLLSLEVERKVG
jgi:hypothetical protein